MVPPSGNHYKKPCRYTGPDGYSHLGFKLTKEVKAYYDAVALFARGRTVAPASESERKTTRYRVEMNVYFPPGKRGDIDNHAKAGLDALVRCGMIHSDHNITDLRMIPHRDDRENPRTEYIVERLEPKE